MNPANHTVYHTPPSISVLLSELPGIDGGSKVRFLGWYEHRDALTIGPTAQLARVAV